MSSTSELVRARVLSLPRRFRPESANGLVAEWELRIGRQSFAISVEGHACTVTEGPSGSPQAVISTGPSTWLAIDEGRLPGEQAFLDRRLEVTGNLDLASASRRCSAGTAGPAGPRTSTRWRCGPTGSRCPAT